MMKVLIFGNRIFSVDMLWGFRQAGCETRIINPATVAQMERVLEDSNPDLMLTLGAPLEYPREVLDYIGKRATPRMKYIHWDTDGISSKYYRSVTGDGIEMDLIHLSKPNLVLSMCPEMLEFIRSRGYPCERMDYAYSPLTHHPMKGYDNDQYYINLVGNSYIEYFKYYPDHFRYQSIKILLKPLLENGHTVHFRGDTGYRPLLKTLLGVDVPPQYFHGYLPYEKTCALYNSSFINLVTQNHEQTITKRTFEILGSGGFALSSDNAGIRRLFLPGRDLVASASPAQTLEIVEYYKSNPDKWLEIRKNAVDAVKNHTYKQRAEYILSLYQRYWP